MLLLDDALVGGGRLVLCTGEAGIGKTRLAEEAAASAAARGVPVAWARAADRDSLPPYGLWQLVLDEPAVRAAGDDPSGVGLWSRVFGDAERPALADGADTGSAQRFAMFAEVRRLDPHRFRRHHPKWHDGLRGENRKWDRLARSTPRNIRTRLWSW